MKIKPLRSAAREGKRYIAFEVIADKEFSAKDASSGVYKGLRSFLGEFGLAGAGVTIFKDKYLSNKGLLRVNYRFVDEVRGAFTLITTILETKVIVRSLGASGMITKAQQRYVKEEA